MQRKTRCATNPCVSGGEGEWGRQRDRNDGFQSRVCPRAIPAGARFLAFFWYAVVIGFLVKEAFSTPNVELLLDYYRMVFMVLGVGLVVWSKCFRGMCRWPCAICVCLWCCMHTAAPVCCIYQC